MDWREDKLESGLDIALGNDLGREIDSELSNELDSDSVVALGDLSALSLQATNDSPDLGELPVSNEDEEGVRSSASTKENKLLLGALVISLLVHGALASLVLNARLSLQQEPNRDVVEIQLIPTNPLLAEETAEPEEEIAEDVVVEIAEVEELIEPEIIEPEIIEEIVEEVPQEIAEVITPEEPTTLNEPQSVEEQIETSELFIPSIVNGLESLDAIEEENTSSLWAYDCDSIQEESELRTCNPDDRRNYEVVERNTTYENLNPVRVLSRGTRTLQTVAANSPELAARLQASDLPDGLGDYVMEQVEASITHHTNPGNLVIDNINIMTEDGAAALAREVMNNPWAVNQAKLRRQRNVHAQ